MTSLFSYRYHSLPHSPSARTKRTSDWKLSLRKPLLVFIYRPEFSPTALILQTHSFGPASKAFFEALIRSSGGFIPNYDIVCGRIAVINECSAVDILRKGSPFDRAGRKAESHVLGVRERRPSCPEKQYNIGREAHRLPDGPFYRAAESLLRRRRLRHDGRSAANLMNPRSLLGSRNGEKLIKRVSVPASEGRELPAIKRRSAISGSGAQKALAREPWPLLYACLWAGVAGGTDGVRARIKVASRPKSAQKGNKLAMMELQMRCIKMSPWYSSGFIRQDGRGVRV